ncbi:MAG TPA: hypothetical protein VD995_05940 [Azospirillum sp.]|nr:hypothetical protein [Azospirillum sp.]
MLNSFVEDWARWTAAERLGVALAGVAVAVLLVASLAAQLG